jgi:hypothetical protein
MEFSESRRSSGVEHVIGNAGVSGSIPLGGTISGCCALDVRFCAFSTGVSVLIASTSGNLYATLVFKKKVG